MPKICDFETCRKYANYGAHHSKPTRCKEHKGEYQLVSKICIEVGCKIRSSFNFEGLSSIFCVEHKKNSMYNVANVKCIYEGCKTRPTYNFEEETKALYCSKHKITDMIDVYNKNKKCIFEGCCNISSFNYKQELKAIYCSKHKITNMIDIKHKKCIFQGCDIQPTYNFEGEKHPIYCCKHKEINMIDVKSKKCIFEGCDKLSSFNFEGETTKLYCGKHKEINMICIISCVCIFEECKIQPIYNFEGQKKGLYCSKHRLDGMVDIKNKKCKANYCLGSQANVKYKGYCASCYKQSFPNDPLTLQMCSKTKEIAVRDFINLNFEGFHHDISLWTGNCDCTHRRRIDHRKLIGNTLLCIETDENQHKGYDKDKEEIRYDDLFMLHSGKFIFIRFNPDKFKNKDGKSSNPMLYTRLPILKDEIEKQIKRIENDENKELLEIEKLYYDE
jgi:hypothetical protein